MAKDMEEKVTGEGLIYLGGEPVPPELFLKQGAGFHPLHST